MKAIIVTGDRHATAETWTRAIVHRLKRIWTPDHPILIEGGQTGIDTLAGDLGKAMGYQKIPLPAQWNQHGKSAGPRRNRAMLSILLTLREHGYEVEVIGFHDDFAGSRGTKNMIEIARAAGVPVSVWTSGGELVESVAQGGTQ